MTAYLAVSPTTKTPGFYVTVNLLASEAALGAAALKLLIQAPASSSGDLTADTEVRQIYSPEEALTAWGPKTPGYVAYLRAYEADRNGAIFAQAPTESAGAIGTLDLTFDDATPVTVAQTVRIWVGGQYVDVPWGVGEADTVAAARAETYIDARDDIPVSASVASAVLTLDAVVKGPWGNDIIVRVELLGGTGGAVTGAGNLASGATEPVFTTALATIAQTEYDYIVPCLSSAEVESATGNAESVETHINTYETGKDALLQQAVMGSTGTIANTKTGSAARNDECIEYICCVSGQSLPCEWAAWEAADRMKQRRLKSVANRIGRQCGTLVGSADVLADKPTPAEEEDALGNGISIVTYDAQGNPHISRSISTHSLNSGSPDYRCYDVPEVDGVYDVVKDIRAALPQAFQDEEGNAPKVSEDIEIGDDPLPEGVVEVRDIKQWLIERLKQWSKRGVVQRAALQASVDNGTLTVDINSGDATQVDIFMPLSIYKLWAKTGLYAAKVA